jgi:hypothetical protein
MKITFTLIDDSGKTFEGSADLSPVLSRRSASKKTKLAPSYKPAQTKFTFDINERAFMKAHAGHLNGGKRFALVLAYLAKGNPKTEVALKDIDAAWNRMTSLLGEFNIANFRTMPSCTGWSIPRRRASIF